MAIPLGVIAAVKQNSWIDNTSSLVAFLGISVPEVFLALLLIDRIGFHVPNPGFNEEALKQAMSQ